MKPLILVDDKYSYHFNLVISLKSRLPAIAIDDVWKGNELVEKIRQQDYGLILTDYDLGNLCPNGLEISRQLREAEIKIAIYLYASYDLDQKYAPRFGVNRVFNMSNQREIIDAIDEFYKNNF